jgi:hypothetical protein
VFNHPSYTFSIPHKRLYTLFKGTTVTPGFIRASSVSSHSRIPLHAAPFISSSYGALCTPNALTCGAPCPSDETGATTQVAPSAPKRSTTPPQPHGGSEASYMAPSCSTPVPSQRAGPLVDLHLRRRSLAMPNQPRASQHLWTVYMRFKPS